MALLIYVSKQEENGQFPIYRCDDGRKLIQIGACPMLDESQVIYGIALAVGLQEDETIQFTEDCGTHLIYRISREEIADACEHAGG